MVDYRIPPRTCAATSTMCYNQSLRLRLTAHCASGSLEGPDAQPVGRNDSAWRLPVQKASAEPAFSVGNPRTDDKGRDAMHRVFNGGKE